MRHKPFYNPRNLHGIGVKLFLSYFLIGIVPLFYLAFSGYKHSLKIVKYHELKNLLSISQLQANEITKYMKERKRSAFTLLLDPIVSEGTLTLIKASKGSDSKEYIHYQSTFKSWLSDYQLFTKFKNISLTDTKGNLLITLNDEKNLQLVKRKTIKNEILTTNFLPTNDSLKTFSAYMSLPVLKNNQILGFYIFEIGLNSVINTDEFLFGLENTGNIHIGVSYGEDTIFPNHSTNGKEFNKALKVNNTRLTKMDGYDLGNNQFRVIEKLGGKEVYSVVNNLKDINLKIIITKKWSEIFRPVIKRENLVRYTQIALFIFIILFSIFIARYFSKPIITLTEKIRGIETSNHLVVDFNSKRRDEIGDLIFGFKRMVQNLAKEKKEKREFIHVLCHDLKNPIAMAITVLDLIKLRPEKTEKHLPKLSIALNQVLSIIDLVRTMMALEEGKMQLILVDLNLKETVNKSLNIINQKLMDKNIQLNANIHEDHMIKAEETSIINSVVNNLLTNAIKFSKEGSKIELVSTKEDSKIILKVRDYGIGMPKVLLDKIFDANETTSRQGTSGEDGTGFGMPLVKKFVEAYGGTIEIWSKEIEESPTNHGTEIIITLKSIS